MVRNFLGPDVLSPDDLIAQNIQWSNLIECVQIRATYVS